MSNTHTSAQSSPPKRAVYSALVGGYEALVEKPAHSEPHVDYLLFTDSNKTRAPAGWKMIRIVPRFNNDSVRSARYLKIVGHPALDGYDETLWIDNRVVLRTPATSLFELLGDDDIALPRHSFRSDLRSEFVEVIASGYDDPQRVRAMFDIAVNSGVERQTPMWTGIMLRKRNPDVQACMQFWFELLLLTSRRDQLSVNVALTHSPAKLRVLEIDNISSDYHRWVSHTLLDRDTSIQMWRANRRPMKIRLSDAMRSHSLGRKAAKAATKMGLTIPTLD
ncbi:hypothetical protein [Mycolicibacterium iranicum]|uniref:Uncharacterized protein n=1 Tax=Mycolicibacterium iranicum TaxID=912594 RepID=A0ABT4HFM0_MYCIR|nr:hypothetical protein [Mycolicibacterium iranicum]MCZ0728993.1 hypothetical protein [Mycolicibacterium iranicum]